MEFIKSIFWYNGYTLIGLLILLCVLYMINWKLGSIETFADEGDTSDNKDNETALPREKIFPDCVENNHSTFTGLVMCENNVCSNRNCCSHVSLPRIFPLVGPMKCISFEVAQKIRGITK